jgi:hypothetical protein
MKYELTTNFIEDDGKILYRIKALKDFGDVKAGDVGGYIEKESNLSQEGDCWVFPMAKVSGNAKVYGYAEICGNAEISGHTQVGSNSIIY